MSPQEDPPAAAGRGPAPAPGLAPGPLVTALARLLGAWRTVAAAALAAVLAALALHYVLPRRYTARTLLSISQPQGDARMPALPGQVAALLPAFSGSNPDTRLVTTLLRSRSVADSMSRRFPGVVITAVQQPADGSLTVDVTHRDPRRAAAAANAYPDVLNSTLIQLNAQKRARRQAVLQDQVGMARRDLDASQQALVQFERAQHAPALDEQARQTVQAGAGLQQLIAQKEVALAQLRRVATPDNPQLRAAEAELADLRRQLTDLGNGGAAGGFLLSMRASPELKTTGLRLLGEYTKDQQAYLSLLAAQTQSQIESADNLPVVTVVDPAPVPTVPTGAGPLTVAALALVLGALAGIAFVLGGDALRAARTDPRYAPLFAATRGTQHQANGRPAPAASRPERAPAAGAATRSPSDERVEPGFS